MNISGLNVGQAVNFEQGVVVNCPRHTYLNGVEVSGQVFVSQDDVLETKHTKVGSLLHYEYNGKKISIEEWQKLWRDLKDKYEKYVDEDDDYFFPTDEVYGHYLIDSNEVNKWKPVRSETITEYKPYEPELIGSVVDTSSDFIQQSIRYGKMKHDGQGVFKVGCGQIARDEVHQHKSVMEVEIPTHSNIQYIKVNGKYIFTNSSNPFVKNYQHSYYTDDLQDAINKEFEIREYVRKLIATKTDTSPFSMADGYNKLEIVFRKLHSLDVKKKSETDLRHTIRAIKELMEEVSK